MCTYYAFLYVPIESPLSLYIVVIVSGLLFVVEVVCNEVLISALCHIAGKYCCCWKSIAPPILPFCLCQLPLLFKCACNHLTTFTEAPLQLLLQYVVRTVRRVLLSITIQSKNFPFSLIHSTAVCVYSLT